MNLKELIAKALKGEALTDDEKKSLSEFDPDTIAAAARKGEADKRKQAEKEKADLQAKYEEAQAKLDEASESGKSVAEKEKAALEKALLKVKAAEEKAAKAEADFSAHRRNAKLEGHLSKLDFVDPKAREIAKLDFLQRFKDLDEKGLDDEAALKPILDNVQADYKALLKDTSGHGGGSRDKGQGSTQKTTVKRSDFDGMKATQQDAFIKSGGKVEN